ncbi:uncharacterized protein E0L32_003346 [Thyridium curvatum]|uniref:Chromo domain-containing protein n=1 Tax=Thyridium curvatum TaxID=1093900 RepID=A0A507BKP5_9PEZI|nr:uncharacterized protein E0L32_003346 [Thyridium curvatum]TPX17228.1 hypothetical protein E0L32_003346 [Thyridium curvatum]
MMDALLPARSVFFGRGEEPPSPPVEDQPLPSSEPAAPGLVVPDVVSDEEGEEEEEEEEEDDNGVASPEPTVVRLDEGPVAPVAPMEADASATLPRKRGRPSLSASASRNGTPARSGAGSTKTPGTTTRTRTPRTAAKGNATGATPAVSSSRKRKAAVADVEEEAAAAPAPAKRAARGRPPASRPVSARKAATEAKKNLGPTKQAKVRGFNPVKPALISPSTDMAVQTKPATKGKRGRPRKEQSEGEEDGDSWEVEAILDSGIDADSSQHMYLVKWKGYSDKDNTWEPKRNLSGCADLIQKFEASNKKARKPRQKKTE